MALTQVSPGLLDSQAAAPTFRNRIINGAMMIDQRNAGASQTITAGTAPYTVDRFGLYCAGANQTSQQVSATASGFQYGLQITGASGATAATLFQRIESKNIADLASQTVTLSFSVYNSGSSASMTIQPMYPSSADNYSSPTNFSSTSKTIPNGWSVQTYTFTLNANCTNGLGIDFQFGALGAGVYRIITGVQLEAGSVATPFEFRPYGTELALCQRYFAKSFSQNVAVGASSTLGMKPICIYYSGVFTWQLGVSFPVDMRVAPSVTVYDGAGNANKISYKNNSAVITNNITDTGTTATTIGTTGFTGAVSVSTTGSYFLHYAASAEL